MTQARAVAVILLPPEYRPTDPFPPHAPDDPGWEFETYDDYWWWMELNGPELRIVIHDPQNGDTQVRRIARPPMEVRNISMKHSAEGIINGAIPMKSGVLFIGKINNDLNEKSVSYCRYATSSDVPPPEDLATVSGYSFLRALTDDSAVIYCPGSVYESVSGMIHIVTPEPAPGQSVVVTVDAPNFIGGSWSLGYRFLGAEVRGQNIEVFGTEYGF